MKNFTLTISTLLLATGLWAQPCSNLFFSEYIEGTSFNKAVEIYNPTGAAIDLSNYRVILKGFNGTGAAFTPETLSLSGSLASGDVYVLANIDADAAILAVADLTDSIVNFNGNDAFALYDVSLGQVIDAVGDYAAATNPANGEWTVGTGSTKDNTLLRKTTVQAGTSNWVTGATQWDVLPSNTFSNIGIYCGSCVSSTDTSVAFVSTASTINDNAATANVGLALSLCVSASTFSVDVVLKSGDAALVNNFTTQSVSFASVVTGTLPLTITTAALASPQTLVFALRNPSSGLNLGADSLFTLTIRPTPTAQVYTIAQVRGNNTDGLPDSLGVVCVLRGTVLGVNLRTTGVNFTINDGTAGIGVFSPTDDFGYTVSEGDSIEVTGEVSHFNGLAQMSFVTDITVLGTGNVPAPVVVVDLNEDTEGELIQLNGYRAFGQPTGNNPLTYDITNGNDTTEMVVYASTGISTTIPATFNVIGIGRQFDAGGGTPVRYTRFYQIGPRKPLDISPVGIEEVYSGVLAVYPNPANNALNITLEANTQTESVKVFDFTGRLVMEQAVNSGATAIKMDISSLSNGMYVVQVATVKGISSHKVVKQ
jgi:hypothetical protein